MKKPMLLLITPFLLTGCGSMSVAAKTDKYQMEMTLHKTRADLEELKHDLHTQKMEVSIIEGKLVNQEDFVANLKKETFDLHENKLDQFSGQIANLEKKLGLFEKKQEEILQAQSKLVQSTTELHKAIAQSKDRINEMEKIIALQSKSANEVAKLKKNVEKVAQLVEGGTQAISIEPYTVKSGDTLEEIARSFGTSPSDLVKMNKLDSEKVIAGQELLVPTISIK